MRIAKAPWMKCTVRTQATRRNGQPATAYDKTAYDGSQRDGDD